MCAARARKCASLFAQRGAGGAALGPESIRDNPFLVTFLGKQKSDKALGKDMVVLRNPIVHVNILYTG